MKSYNKLSYNLIIFSRKAIYIANSWTFKTKTTKIFKIRKKKKDGDIILGQPYAHNLQVVWEYRVKNTNLPLKKAFQFFRKKIKRYLYNSIKLCSHSGLGELQLTITYPCSLRSLRAHCVDASLKIFSPSVNPSKAISHDSKTCVNYGACFFVLFRCIRLGGEPCRKSFQRTGE